jgi:hypothetical protein
MITDLCLNCIEADMMFSANQKSGTADRCVENAVQLAGNMLLYSTTNGVENVFEWGYGRYTVRIVFDRNRSGPTRI